jgi:hypothetical protein
MYAKERREIRKKLLVFYILFNHPENITKYFCYYKGNDEKLKPGWTTNLNKAQVYFSEDHAKNDLKMIQEKKILYQSYVRIYGMNKARRMPYIKQNWEENSKKNYQLYLEKYSKIHSVKGFIKDRTIYIDDKPLLVRKRFRKRRQSQCSQQFSFSWGNKSIDSELFAANFLMQYFNGKYEKIKTRHLLKLVIAYLPAKADFEFCFQEWQMHKFSFLLFQ